MEIGEKIADMIRMAKLGVDEGGIFTEIFLVSCSTRMRE